MKTIKITGTSSNSTIAVGESLKNCHKYLPHSHIVIITDDQVYDLYGDSFPNADLIKIGQGETIKTLETVQQIYEQMIHFETDRTSFVLGIGGGIVCDISGFVASTYMRGIDFGFVASTLLAQVDASVGGKNGVNVQGYKNMAGVFNQPSFSICDPNMLLTLTDIDYQCGLAEIVKHAIISDRALFQFIEQNISEINNRSFQALERLVYDSVVIKSTIVNQDEKESGIRKKLNLGHTFGHAIEKMSQIPHGQAVSIGMVMAASYACNHGLMDHSDLERIQALLTQLHLPISSDIPEKSILEAMKKDKKRKSDTIFLVLPRSIGHVTVEPCPIDKLDAPESVFYESVA